jgi:hypothetical protein
VSVLVVGTFVAGRAVQHAVVDEAKTLACGDHYQPTRFFLVERHASPDGALAAGGSGEVNCRRCREALAARP